MSLKEKEYIAEQCSLAMPYLREVFDKLKETDITHVDFNILELERLIEIAYKIDRMYYE